MSQARENFDAVVIGAGAAGLACAGRLAAHGVKTVILEHGSRAGRKLLITGGGRCNITNALKTVQFARRFGEKWRFVLPALKNFSPESLREFFAAKGVNTVLTDDFHYFPESGRAQDILDVLLDGCRNAVFKYNFAPEKIMVSPAGDVCGVCGSGVEIHAPRVIVCCGGTSYPGTGSDGSGYKLAGNLGHRIVTPVPAMVGLRTRETWPGECAGISLPDAELSIAMPGEKERCRGELLFTKQGISAFAVLDISGRIARMLLHDEEVPVKLNLLAGMNKERFIQIFQDARRQNGTRSIGKILAAYLPKKLIPAVCPVPETAAARFSTADMRATAANITEMQLHICGTDGWQKAQVTSGGVDIGEVDEKSMESKLVKGLFFAGEVLDIDGPCGGYNLQWAVSSGVLAATSVAALHRG